MVKTENKVRKFTVIDCKTGDAYTVTDFRTFSVEDEPIQTKERETKKQK